MLAQLDHKRPDGRRRRVRRCVIARLVLVAMTMFIATVMRIALIVTLVVPAAMLFLSVVHIHCHTDRSRSNPFFPRRPRLEADAICS